MAKQTNNKIILTNENLGDEPFEKAHAERILQFDADKKVTNWTLKDSKLTFENGKIITRTSVNPD